MLDAQRLATTFDYEAYAKQILDMPTFEHFKGQAILRNKETIKDFDLIKLKARGLMSMAKFTGTSTTILG